MKIENGMRAIAGAAMLVMALAGHGQARAEPAPEVSGSEAKGQAIVEQALAQAGAGEFAEALATLDRLEDGQARSYAARLAKARILSWASRYAEAKAEFDGLEQDYPANADTAIGHAFLSFYRKDYDDAEARFLAVLAANPDYEEARIGLDRVRAAQMTATQPAALRSGWQLSYGVEISSFSRSQNKNWSLAHVQFGRIIGQRNIHLRAERYRRFGLGDVMLSAGTAFRAGAALDMAIDLEATPHADFRPQWGLDAEAGLRLDPGGLPVTGLRPFLRYGFDKYAEQSIHTAQPGMQLFWRGDWSFDARGIVVFQSREETLYGAAARLTAPLSPRLRATVGAASAPEADNGVVTQTNSIFAGVVHDLSDTMSIRGDYTRDDRRGTYVRNAFSVSLAHRF